MVAVQPPLCDMPVGNRLQYGAAGFPGMAAVVEAAFPQVWPEFAEGVLDLVRRQVGEAEFLQARRINQVAGGIQMVQVGRGGGVLAAVQCRGNFAGSGIRIRQQGVYQRGLAMPDCPTSTLVWPASQGRNGLTSCLAESASTS